MKYKTITAGERIVDVTGGNIFVKSWVPKRVQDQVPIFLLHDSLGCVKLWRDFPLSLSEKLGRIVVAYDRLGFGQSSARLELPSKHFINEEAEIYFPALLNALEVTTFDLFGHSVGGAMALTCAAKISGCRSVVSESAQMFVEERTLEGISKAKLEFAKSENLEKLAKYHGDKVSWVLRAWFNVWSSKEFANWTMAPTLPHVHCPVLAIHGDNDEYGSQAFPEMIRDLAGGKSTMHFVTDCGHLPHREKPDLVLDFLREFYDKLYTHDSISSQGQPQ